MCSSHRIPHSRSELRPRMLKELLADESYANSIYSNKKSSPKLLRNRSSKAALTTIFAIRKAFNAVKYLQFSTVKSPSVSPKSKPEKYQNDDVEEISSTVKVKDILRWRSFRDLVDEKPPPLDFSTSPHRCTTATTTSTGSNSTRSSWCDSDFTAEDSELYSGNVAGDDCTDRKSSQFCIDFDEEEENVALEKAKAVVNAVQAITSKFQTNSSVDHLLFDFFRDELNTNDKQRRNCEINCEVLRVAKNWVSGEDERCLKWKLGGSKELCMREMEWGHFGKEERENLAIEMENEVLSSLLDELLIDLVDREEL